MGKFKYLIFLLIVLLSFVMLSSCGKPYILGSATEEMTDAEYWNVTDDVVMNSKEIKEFNQKIIDDDNVPNIDILKAKDTIKATAVKDLIKERTINEDDIYLGKEKITKSDKKALVESTNLDALKGTIEVHYGIMTEPANLRAFPTDEALTYDGITEGKECFDDFQLTRFRLGEGVLIYHKSLDDKFYFVRGANYYGWMDISKIGLCSKEKFIDYLSSKNFIVTTELKETSILDKKVSISMGTKFNLDGDKIVIPSRDNEGKLELDKVDEIDISSNAGYLPYTTRNIYNLALSQLGDVYDWGGQFGHYDCSDFIMAVYQTVGIDLPRDAVSSLEFNCVNLTKAVNENKLLPGSILVMDGHYVLYLGNIDGELYGIHVLAETYNSSKKLQKPYLTVISSTSDLWRHGGEDTMRSTIYKGFNIK